MFKAQCPFHLYPRSIIKKNAVPLKTKDFLPPHSGVNGNHAKNIGSGIFYGIQQYIYLLICQCNALFCRNSTFAGFGTGIIGNILVFIGRCKYLIE